MDKKMTALIIMDGFGINPAHEAMRFISRVRLIWTR